MKTHTILLTTLVLFTHWIYGATIDEMVFSDHQTLNGENLKLNGLGLRKATVFKVKVYAAGLYLLEPQHETHKVIQLKNPKILVMKFMREVSQEKINDAWDKAFEEKAAQFAEEIKQLKKLMPNAKEGDTLEYIFWDDKTEFKINQTLKGTMAGGAWGKALLNTWIGSHPPTEELKDGLLGLKH